MEEKPELISVIAAKFQAEYFVVVHHDVEAETGTP